MDYHDNNNECEEEVDQIYLAGDAHIDLFDDEDYVDPWYPRHDGIEWVPAAQVLGFAKIHTQLNCIVCDDKNPTHALHEKYRPLKLCYKCFIIAHTKLHVFSIHRYETYINNIDVLINDVNFCANPANDYNYPI